MRTKIENLMDLLNEQTGDVYKAKKQQLDVLPNLKDRATSRELKDNIDRQIQETRNQVQRLGQFFNNPRQAPKDEDSRCMKSLIDESIELANRCQNEKVRDAAIITAIQHMNHYNIASYGAASTYAKELDQKNDASLLNELLESEKRLDQSLTKTATEKVNLNAIPA
jgi:ferritin-like metal-binding protein YciE